MADRVFENRLGVWNITPGNLGRRLPAMAELGIRDVFLPRTASRDNISEVREAGLAAHVWSSVDGLRAHDYANRVLLDVDRLGPRGFDLNVELSSDAALPEYLLTALGLIRSRRPNLRVRFNLAAWKGFALARMPWDRDENLYACVQAYSGSNMDNLLSAGDVLWDMIAWGVPMARATVCYAAHCRVLGSDERLRTLPDLTRLNRGVVFSDDLMHDAGLLP